MQSVRQFIRLATVAVLGLVLAACQPSDPSSPKVATLQSIAVAPGSATLDVGARLSLRVLATYSDGSTADVSGQSSFSSSNASIAEVNATGVVTARASGAATITATEATSGRTATAAITVSPLRIVSIAVTPASLSVQVGATQQLTVIATYNDLSTGNVTAGSTFESGDSDIATVGSGGLVTGVAEGSTSVTVTVGGATANVPVSVTTTIVLTPLVGGVWASNYSQLDANNWLSTEGGSASNYIDTSVPTQYWWNGVAPDGTPPNYYFGYGINSATKPWGFGTFVKAPGNGTADVTGYSSVMISVWGNDELMNTHPTLTVILKGPTVSGCSYELKGTIAVAAPGVQTYTLPLDGFTLQAPCGHASVAEALATGLSEVHVQVLGDNVQYVTPADGAGNYANGLNVGPITFKSAAPTSPTTHAPTPPARDPADVLSVYSNAYAQIAGVNLNPNWGQSTVVTQVVIEGDDTLKYANLNYQGTDWAGSPIDVTGMSSLHLDAWTTDVASLKVSIISPGLENPVTLTPTAGAWNSFDIDLSQYTVPDKSAIIQIKIEGTPTGGTVYLDNIYFWRPAASGFNGVWSSNYAQIDGFNWVSTEGGDAGTYIDGSVPTQYWWNGVAPGDTPPSFYFGYGINSATKPWGFGAFVKAPGNGTVDVSGYGNLKIYVWGNDELMNQHPSLTVVLIGPPVAGCAAEVQGTIAVSAPGVQQYTLPLSGFTMRTPCGYATPADVIAGGLAQVHVQVLGDNVQYAVPADGAGNYANGLNIGPISFQ